MRLVLCSVLLADRALARCSGDCLSQYVCHGGLVNGNDAENTLVAHKVGVVEGATRRHKRRVAGSSVANQSRAKRSGASKCILWRE